MFDYINCEATLPVPNELKDSNINWKRVDFQTKDLDCCMSYYVITHNGFLDEIVTEYDYIPFSEGETPPNPWTLYKQVNEKNKYTKPINHHGKIKFYSVVECLDSKDFEYIVEYLAYFIYGHLDKIDLIECKKISSQSYNMEEWRKKRDLENKLFKNKVKRFLGCLGWFWFWRQINHVLYVFEQTVSSIRMFVIKKML